MRTLDRRGFKVGLAAYRFWLQSWMDRFDMGSWSISSRIYSQILVPLRHLHTNAKPKFITAMDRCFNARHHSSNPVSTRKMLTTAPPKFVQRLTTARGKLAKQRWSSVQDFCIRLVDPSVHELASSGAKLWLGVVGAVVNFAGAEKLPAPHRSQYFVQLKTFGVVGGIISGGRAYTALP